MSMQEKDILIDALSTTKSSLGIYNMAIMETSNMQLRNTLQQLRDGAEQFQYQLYQIAEQKGYYQAPQAASQQELQQAKTSLLQG
ncbi:putative spore coat protein, CotF-like protein [Gottschalkia acidurici 9a]|uniref:Spore coat protein, CotF-like protein n=1 Tax=Gottschalkia acidurici (strain ATCC 7906 / DSM 604 / BCRC 14475 / CIP 104303 / KCTC 5404 / NCIMB 10678 / 9a) TaxID=1128398 RepID=K0AX09_GOTA9|nr:spore coat protein [Gottschalkia acidurici]AFS77774.1 putative spore coat protein, CotF-like protein [Gottschalkia acidurici 9a]